MQMRLSLFLLILLQGIGPIIAQDATSMQRLGETEIPESLRQMFATIIRADLEDDYHLFFLDKESATRYVEEIFGGTENAHDAVKRDAIATFYQTLSSQAASFLSLYQASLLSINIADAKVRQGAAELMKVWVLRLDLHFEDGSVRGQRVNVVETDNGFRILNIEF